MYPVSDRFSGFSAAIRRVRSEEWAGYLCATPGTPPAGFRTFRLYCSTSSIGTHLSSTIPAQPVPAERSEVVARRNVSVSLFQSHFVADWISEVVDPLAVIQAYGGDHQCVALPFAGRVSIPSRQIFL